MIIYLITLATVERQLQNINNPDAENVEQHTDIELVDTEAHGIKEMWKRISSQLNTDSMLFRHAIRLGDHADCWLWLYSGI